MSKVSHSEHGSALVEAAIIFPILMLIIWWSAALTDVMVLKLKASEAARFSLWETTVFRSEADIKQDMKQRFVDLRSPSTINVSYTGLMMYPLASNLDWKATIDTRQHVGLGGALKMPPSNIPLIGNFINMVLGSIASGVDAALAHQQFNMNGKAAVRVTLVRATHDEHASIILKGGDLLGNKGGNDLDHPKSMTNFTFETPLGSEKPMQLVFDTWKAWPKPAAYTTDGAPTNTSVSPMNTYPTVEKQVSVQVSKIAFFGLTRYSWFNSVRNIGNRIAGSGIAQFLLGGRLPDVFSSEPMDGPQKGPMTILPPERPDVGFAPGRCTGGPCATQRVGELTSSSGPQYPDRYATLGDHVDRTRYTLPYKINTQYWRQSGGTDQGATGSQLTAPKAKLVTNNEYVKSYACRGHYFAGSTRPQETNLSHRYKGCNK
jgi:hypothetical protein